MLCAVSHMLEDIFDTRQPTSFEYAFNTYTLNVCHPCILSKKHYTFHFKNNKIHSSISLFNHDMYTKANLKY